MEEDDHGALDRSSRDLAKQTHARLRNHRLFESAKRV